jgi:quercetin dioxygenase-like cupin family protein
MSRFAKFRPLLALATIGVTGLSAVPMAHAGQCPADQVRLDGTGQKKDASPASGVTDTVLTSVDLGSEPVNVQGRLLRLRKLVIQPGGVVPWHEHANRPAIIFIIQGEIVEYASTCAVPIVHRAGESTAEGHATAHWWKNTGKEPVVLLSADLFPLSGKDQHTM